MILCSTFFHETNIRHEERVISKLEDELDETCTTAAQALDKLISAQKVACSTTYKTVGLNPVITPFCLSFFYLTCCLADAELEASALARKLQQNNIPAKLT